MTARELIIDYYLAKAGGTFMPTKADRSVCLPHDSAE